MEVVEGPYTFLGNLLAPEFPNTRGNLSALEFPDARKVILCPCTGYLSGLGVGSG